MLEYYNPISIDTYQNTLQVDGQLIHAVNVYSPGVGIKAKRPGYGTFLGNLGAKVNSLFTFAPYPTSGTTNLYLYAASGSQLNYSLQGTGAWTLAAGSAGGDSGGTITNGNRVGHAILNNTLILGDGAGSTRHTTVGTTFTNTVLAPVAQYFSQFHNRVYTSDGTSGLLQYSVANDATNWNTGGTSDSSAFIIPESGAVAQHWKSGDRLIITKTRGDMFNWDDTTLVDMCTRYGPSSPWSVAQIDDMSFYINQYGAFSFDGANKQLISNFIQNQFYNPQNSGVGTAALGTAPATTHYWDYLVAVGTITDPFVGRTISNAIIKYDYQKNEFLNWSFNDAPTAFHSYIDINNQRQLLFGDQTGQVYQLDRTKTSDNGKPIQTEMVFLFTYASQGQMFSQQSAVGLLGSSYEKKWNWIRLFFNPGDEVNIQYAFSNTLTYQHLKWSEVINTKQRTGDYYQVSDGVVEMRFPPDPNNVPRSRFMFLRIYDNSDNSQWQYRGCSIDAEPQLIK